MFFSRSNRLGLGNGVPAKGLANGVPAEGLAGVLAGSCTAGLGADSAAGGEIFGLAFVSTGIGEFTAPGNGVVPSTTLAAERVGTGSLSFFTRMETLRLEGSVGLLFTRNIWSA
jgi:hypothetical protein